MRGAEGAGVVIAVVSVVVLVDEEEVALLRLGAIFCMVRNWWLLFSRLGGELRVVVVGWVD